MGWERLLATCHKSTETWHRGGRSQKRSRGHTGIHPSTLTLSCVWGLEYTHRHTPPQIRRLGYYKIECRYGSKYESKMAYKRV